MNSKVFCLLLGTEELEQIGALSKGVFLQMSVLKFDGLKKQQTLLT